LRADIRALPIQRRWIVHAEKHVEQIPVADLLGVESDLHDFCVPGGTCTHLLVRWIRTRAARVARDDALHAAQLAENRVDAPEAPGAQRGDFGLWIRHV